MNVLKFIVRKKDNYRSERTDLKNDYKVANKLGFIAETNRIERDISKTSEILELLEDITVEVQKEKVFTETEISHLQSEVHKITGDGEVMQLFNKLLGVNAGATVLKPNTMEESKFATKVSVSQFLVEGASLSGQDFNHEKFNNQIEKAIEERRALMDLKILDEQQLLSVVNVQ